MYIIKQTLILPFDKCYIAAGYMNPNYKLYWKYNHRGWDLVTEKASENDKILSSGYGKVLTAGRDSKVGNVIAIMYYNVYNTFAKKIDNIIARYMHMSKLSVKVGDEISPGQVLGNQGGWGVNSNSYGVHLHIEFDTDTAMPNYSGQVSGGTIFKAGNSTTMIDPKYIFHLDSKQKLGECDVVYIPSIKQSRYFYTQDDLKIKAASKTEMKEGENMGSTTDKLSQKLILPTNKMKITASYKNKKYESLPGNTSTGRMGTHYGMDFCDIVATKQMWCSGNGTVLATGFDSCFGNFAVIEYDNVYNHATKKVNNYVFRYFHLASVTVKKGQKVTKDTRLGIMGKTGTYATGIHCHLEVDTDTKNWQYTPSLVGKTTYFRAGYRGNGDTTLNPMNILYVKSTAPDNQSLNWTTDGYTNTDDMKPVIL